MGIKTVSIIGLGALGILFGNHLAQKIPKENLRIIADPDRIEKYKKSGVYCNGKICNFNYVTPEEKDTTADLLLFTVKYDGLKDAIQAVQNQVGENTIILSALNGIISEEIIGKGTEHFKSPRKTFDGSGCGSKTVQRSGIVCRYSIKTWQKIWGSHTCQSIPL